MSFVDSYLWSLRLNPPHTSRAVDYCVFRYDFTCVDLTEGSNDTATGEDHIPANVSWTEKWEIFVTVTDFVLLNAPSVFCKYKLQTSDLSIQSRCYPRS